VPHAAAAAGSVADKENVRMSASQGSDRPVSRDLAEEQAEQQRRVLSALMDAYPAQLTKAELEAAVGRIDATDGLWPLIEAGAVHVRGDLTWPARCAVSVYRLWT
jgi:hypothetical protein